MQLRDIVDRLAEGIPQVDQLTTTQNLHRRDKTPFLVSAFNLREDQLVRELASWWHLAHPTELAEHSDSNVEYPYPGNAEIACDLVIGSVADHREFGRPFEWAIEVKRIQLVGDNGKNNDYGITKLLSPYRKDRSVTHDAHRLSAFGAAQKLAVIVIGFDFSPGAELRAFEACKRLRIPTSYAKNLASVIRSEAPSGGGYRLDPAISIADIALRQMGLVTSERVSRRFTDVERHPCGAEGIIAGWEIVPGSGA